MWFCCQRFADGLRVVDRLTMDTVERWSVKRKLSCAGGWTGKSLSILIRSRLGDSLTVWGMLVNSRIDGTPGG
jgi:hypothetical protein